MKLLGLMAIILLFLYVTAACDSWQVHVRRSYRPISLEMPNLPRGASWHTRVAATIRDDARLIISALADSDAASDNRRTSAV